MFCCVFLHTPDCVLCGFPCGWGFCKAGFDPRLTSVLIHIIHGVCSLYMDYFDWLFDYWRFDTIQESFVIHISFRICCKSNRSGSSRLGLLDVNRIRSYHFKRRWYWKYVPTTNFYYFLRVPYSIQFGEITILSNKTKKSIIIAFIQ